MWKEEHNINRITYSEVKVTYSSDSDWKLIQKLWLMTELRKREAISDTGIEYKTPGNKIR